MVNTLHLNGTSYEIGYKHGTLAKTQIHASLKSYAPHFAAAGLSPGDVQELASSFAESIKAKVPHLYDELNGIAEGAEVPLLDIVALNARSEIALAATAGDDDDDDDGKVPIPADGCTTFAEAVDDKQWLAQNWDWQTSQISNLVLLEIELPAGTLATTQKLNTITEAGLLAKIGFNSDSVGVCLNALRATDLNTANLPLHVLLRVVLESNSIAEAKRRIVEDLGGGSASYGHFGVADGKLATGGGAESWEIGPYGINVIKPDDHARLFHTNHTIKQDIKIRELPWLEDTYERIDRLRELVAENDHNTTSKPAFTIEQQKDRIFSFLKDEDNYPNSICRANDNTKTGLLGSLQTVFSIIMDLTDKKAWVTVGRPKHVLEAFELKF
ncbi:acyl-coenzyme A:6-aminopenicillanic acid acyl-transferase-domain-containing protein [Lipomyces japonicus]|uniref:acyl-coenzyme A:6-aminopenicillanic acid acyl-transferase-domain-containing protein n=1 Tax=Lipomyces japonicus TaxID=56871 RepID=UPI0034CDD906